MQEPPRRATSAEPSAAARLRSDDPPAAACGHGPAPHRSAPPLEPGARRTAVPAAAPPSTAHARPAPNAKPPGSAMSSTPTANPTLPTSCRSATTAWTCATPSASSWATATWSDALPPKAALPTAPDRVPAGTRSDDRGEHDLVVLARTGRPVEVPAAGDQREIGAVGVPVQGVGERRRGLVQPGHRLPQHLQVQHGAAGV